MSTPGYLEPLGQINANFSEVEADISSLIWTLIGSNKRIGQIVTAQLSFRKLLDTLSALFKEQYKDEDLQNKLKKLLKQADKINAKRNRFVHSVWFTNPTTLRIRRVKVIANRKKGLQMEAEDLSAEELTTFGNEIGSFIFALERFRVKAKL